MTSEKPACVVLGGGGFIGTNLCRRLAATGHRVRAFGAHRLFPQALGEIDWLQGDFTNPDAVASAIESFDVVFHLVHTMMPQAADLNVAGDLSDNVLSTIAMLERCRQTGTKRVVFASSGGTVYGKVTQIPTPETTPTDPICAYGISKLAIEKYLALYAHRHALEYRVLRIANPFGPYQSVGKNQGVIAATIARALRDEPVEIWGDGSVVRDFIFIDDVVDALTLAATDTGEGRVFNIGSGQGRDLRQIIAAIEQQMGQRLRLEWKPGRPIDVPVSVVAIDRAREILAWQPRTSFEDGLRQTIDWARDALAPLPQLTT